MSGPWDQYASSSDTAVAEKENASSGPWSNYQKQEAAPAEKTTLPNLAGEQANYRAIQSPGLEPGTEFTEATEGSPVLAIVGAALGALQNKVIEPAAAGFLNAMTEDRPLKPGMPMVTLPDSEGKGVVPGIERFAQGMTTPGNLVTLPLAAESKAAQGAFMIQAAAGIQDSLKNLATAQTPEEKRDAATELSLQVGMAAWLGRGHGEFKGGENNATSTREAPARRNVSPYQVEREEDGKFVVTAPDGSVISEHGSMAEAKAAVDQMAPKPEERAAVQDQLPPEHQTHLNEAARDIGVNPKIVDASDTGNPFSQRLQGKIATIDRNSGQVLINRQEFQDWLNKDVPKENWGLATRSVLAEEQNHLHTSDADATAFWNTLTPAEKYAHKQLYNGGDDTGMTETLWGHEALNFKMQQLARMTPHQILAESGLGKLKLQSLIEMERAIYGIRKALGTRASKIGLAILDDVQDKIDLAKTAAGASTPAAQARERSDYSEDDLKKYNDLTAKLSSKPSAGANISEFFNQKQSAAKEIEALKNKYGGMTPRQLEQIPAARPRKRNESVFQEKFILPGEATQKPAGSMLAVPISGEAPVVPPEERASAEAAGALPRLTGAQLQERAAKWIESAVDKVSKDLEEGNKSAPPKFKDFAAHMHGLKPGQLHEMWSTEIGQWLDNASGEKLANLVRAIWGRQIGPAQWDITALGKKKFFRSIISGSQKVADPGGSGILAEYSRLEREEQRLRDERADLIDTIGHSREDVEHVESALRNATQMRVALEEPAKRARMIARSRYKVIGALFNKLVKPVMEDINFKADRTDPEDLRYGGGKVASAVQEISALDARNLEALGKMLVDGARSSEDDPLTATKRLTAIMDRKSGTVDLVSTYLHPASGVMLVDPNSPQRTHSPLDSILRRYRVIGSFLRDSPVQGFKQHFASLDEFNDKFFNEARERYQAETSYEPESVSAEEFQREIGGRMQGTQQGHLMGPAKQWIADTGRSELEQSRRTPMQPAEARAILEYVHEQQGTIDSADDVKEAMLALKEDRDHQALSGLIKLARGLQEKNPDLSIPEILDRVAHEIYENHSTAKDIEEFTQRTMVESSPKAGETAPVEEADPDSPAAINRRQIKEERDLLAGEVSTLTGRVMASFGRGANVDKMSATIDASDTLANNEARNAENSIRAVTFENTLKGFYGDKAILAAANAILAAGGIKARYHYDHEVLDEAERLMREDEQIKKMAEWANRKRDVNEPQLKLEGEMANKSLADAIQKKLIEIGHLRPSEAAYYHDPFAKEKLDVFMTRVKNGMNNAARLMKGNAWDRYRGRRWMRGAKELMDELKFAKAHWDNPKLIETAMQMRKELDGQYDLETQNGYHLNYDPDYIPGRYDGELFSQNGVLFGGLRVLGKRFRLAKAFPTYYHAIEAGPYVAASRDGASIVSSRVRQGMRSLNRTMWWNSLKGLKDEESGKMVAANGKLVNGKLSAPSPEYNHQFRTPGGDPIFILDGYEHLVHQLTDPSGIQHWALTRGALEAGQMLKHTVLMGDLFHLGRVAYYAASIAGKNIAWRPGWAALDFREADLPKAVENGMITQQTANWLTEKKPFRVGSLLTTRNRMELSKEFQRLGLNVGQIQDALYKDLVRNVPGFGRYSKFLFDRFTRGHMMNSALREFDRISKIDPNADSRTVMRYIAKDLNAYFGSIGRQGWVKSATFQDLQRLTFLAPQWLEGLVRKEISPIRALSQPGKVFSGRDTMTRGIARGLLSMLVLTQVLNMITRRQPTWKNPEKEHKWDAYLGDNVWLSPTAVFNELAGDLVRISETRPKVWDAIQEIGENKLSFWGRAAMVLATGKSSSGEYQTTTAGVLKSAASQLVPTPISFGKLAKAAGHAVAPGMVGPVSPGQLTSQIMSSLGFKTHTGMDPVTRMEQSAQAFAKERGKYHTALVGYTDEPSYAQLRYFLKTGDEAGARKVLSQLEKTRTFGQVQQAMSIWSRRPFTGSRTLEPLWVGGMTDEERQQYQQAVNERYEILNKFQKALHLPPNR